MARHPDTSTSLEVTQPRHVDGGLEVVITGDIDLATAAWIRQHLIQLLCNRPTRIVLTLDQVPFMDTAGLHAIELIDRYARIVGTELRIAEPTRPVRKLLAYTGMDELELHPCHSDSG